MSLLPEAMMTKVEVWRLFGEGATAREIAEVVKMNVEDVRRVLMDWRL